MDQDFFAFLPSDLTHKRPASKRPKRTFERFRSGWGWDSVLWMSPDQRLRFWALHHRTNGILGIGKIPPRYWSVCCITFWEAHNYLKILIPSSTHFTVISLGRFALRPDSLSDVCIGWDQCLIFEKRSGAKQVLKKVQLLGAFPMLKTTWNWGFREGFVMGEEKKNKNPLGDPWSWKGFWNLYIYIYSRVVLLGPEKMAIDLRGKTGFLGHFNSFRMKFIVDNFYQPDCQVPPIPMYRCQVLVQRPSQGNISFKPTIVWASGFSIVILTFLRGG